MPDLKQLARRIFNETLAGIDISLAMERVLERRGDTLILDGAEFNLREFRDVIVAAVGKAAHSMVEGFTKIVSPDKSLRGVVAAPTEPKTPIAGFTYFTAGHPTPNQASWDAAKKILSELQSCSEKSLVFFLLSGGGSALMELPLDSSQSLEDVQNIYRALVGCGGSIDEINCIRKHLSAVKGGRLAVAASRSKKITLAITDVPVGKESALASGPTVPDPTTRTDVSRILQKYSLAEKFPASARQWIASGKMPETPKAEDQAFHNCHFSLLLGMHELFHHAHQATEAHGFVTCCDNSTDDAPVERAVDSLLSQLEDLRRSKCGARVALIADGEISSPVTGDGEGGRNAAFVLACVEKIAGKPITVLSAGTDGVDGNSPAAGAVADGATLSRAHAAKLDPSDYLRRSDAYSFFKKLDDAIETGPTGNNLRDLRIFLAESV